MKTGKSTAQPKSSKVAEVDFAKLLPEKSLFYVRINHVQRAKNEFINSKHVKDAKTAQPAWLSLLNDLLKTFKQPDGISYLTLWQLANEIKTAQFGAFPLDSDTQPSATGFVGFIEVNGSSGLDALEKQLAGKLKSKSIAGTEVQFIDGTHKAAYYRPTKTSLVMGTQSSIRSLLELNENPKQRSLADSTRFQQALSDFGSSGELMTFADIERLRAAELMTFPLKSVSHLAATLGVDGGFAVRAYATDGQSLPEELTRTSQRKKLLARLPRKTAVLLSAGFDADRKHRRAFAEWVTKLVKTDDIVRDSVVPQGVRKLAKSLFARTDGVENDLGGVVNELWFGLGPVETESAIFVAPNSQGQWGAAALFDTKDAAAVAEFKKKLHAMADRLKLKWQKSTIDGLTIQTLDAAMIFSRDPQQPLPPMVEQLLQLKLGYAESEGLFAVGSIDLIKFVLKPQGPVLAQDFSYEHLDEANAMLFSIQPGRILNQKFGFAPVDQVLRKVAEQIPIDSNYTFTLTLEAGQTTLRSNIPFTSLLGWLVLEWKGEGPAHLKDEFPDAKKLNGKQPAKQ